MTLAATLLSCLVVAVADGDTLTARCGAPGAYEQVKVRLAGVDAPERRQPFGRRARQALAGLCFQQTARIHVHSHDRYGRAVADVECGGKDAGAHMVGGGLAWVFDRYAQQHQHLYPLQASARAQRLGLWADDGTAAPPVPPWDWRKAARSTSAGA